MTEANTGRTTEARTKTKRRSGRRSSGIKRIEQPDRIWSYFRPEKPVLVLIVFSGLLFNVGMVANPYFEGRLAQCLYECIEGRADSSDMLRLVALYLAVVCFVQMMRGLKRFGGRRLKNNISRNMRHMLYNGIVHMSREEVERESTGTIMTKAVSDVDACADGMQKVTTEIFDTGVLLLSYFGLLFAYDWRLTLLSCCFIPLSYIIAGALKRPVTKTNEAYKTTAGRLNQETLDRVSNAVTYRVYGREKNRDASYERILSEYERNAIYANLWGNALIPIYRIVSMSGVVFIIWFGGKNVLGSGWTAWDVGVFATYVSCFTKLAQKASKAAKLFNSVQRAEVSWQRIRPLFQEYVELPKPPQGVVIKQLDMENVSVAYPGAEPILRGISMEAHRGQIIGVTGAVACGKTALAKTFIGDTLYEGSIRLDGRELSDTDDVEKSGLIAFMGHEPQLMSDTIRENILLGGQGETQGLLRTVHMDEEISRMPEGEETYVGNGGQQLSGGQQARISMARTLCHGRSIMVLDDPFSAVDKRTEREIFEELRRRSANQIVLLFSHRLALFPKLDGVLFLHDGTGSFGNHEQLMRENEDYASLYQIQQKGGAGIA